MKNKDTLFDKIVRGEIPSWKVWENAGYLAFLTPFPNTKGQTIVIPKKNVGEYIFSVSEKDYLGLLGAAKKVAKVLEKAFKTPRVAMIFEGTGVAYVHVKLYPLHGNLAGEPSVWTKHVEFYPEYIGYLSTVEGPKMSDKELDEVRNLIVKAQK